MFEAPPCPKFIEQCGRFWGLRGAGASSCTSPGCTIITSGYDFTSGGSPSPSFFQPSRGIVGDPIERVGLSLEASDVFLLSIRVGAHHMPLRPKLDGLGSERVRTKFSAHTTAQRGETDSRLQTGTAP